MAQEFQTGLAPRLSKAYFFIRDGINAGVCPSYREIADHLGLKGRSATNRIVALLVERGYIHSPEGRSRAITLVDRDRDCTVDMMTNRMEIAGKQIKLIEGNMTSLLNIILTKTADKTLASMARILVSQMADFRREMEL